MYLNFFIKEENNVTVSLTAIHHAFYSLHMFLKHYHCATTDVFSPFEMDPISHVNRRSSWAFLIEVMHPLDSLKTHEQSIRRE